MDGKSGVVPCGDAEGLQAGEPFVFLIRVEAFLEAAMAKEDVAADGEIAKNEFGIAAGAESPLGAVTGADDAGEERMGEELLEEALAGKGGFLKENGTADDEAIRAEMGVDAVKVGAVHAAIGVAEDKDVAGGMGGGEIALAGGIRARDDEDLKIGRGESGEVVENGRRRVERGSGNDDGESRMHGQRTDSPEARRCSLTRLGNLKA